MLNPKGLVATWSVSVGPNRFGSCRANETWRARSVCNMLIRSWLFARWPRRTDEGLLNLKDLLTMLPPSCWAIFSGVVGRLKRGGDYLLIRQGLLSKLLRRTEKGLLNLKDLLTLFPPSCRAAFSGFAGRLKRGEGYLLIPQWLLAKLVSRIGDGLLNLKDLLTPFPSRLKGLFENEPVWRRCLATKSYQILPFSTKNVQRTGSNRAQNGGQIGSIFIPLTPAAITR